ncbi:hypothetical protein M0R89_03885 [Halorussus limi]|uniref:ATP-binding protein n=1 Tax=Halorussus limi TaxID=2938695 RepID=A0A8U0HX26_9EURY|nr:hypothetical protein [Halorussus limi]UPV75216.1 hypothetical protein M0R89_03885 [Halorussus limi]
MAKSDPVTNTKTAEEPADEKTNQAESLDEYIHVQPTDNALNPKTVQRQFKRLQQITRSEPDGLLDRFRGPARPTLEFLLVSNTESPLSYYVGIDEQDAVDELERILRSVFPNSYEFDRVEWHTDQLTPSEEIPHEADSEATNIAGVEFQGRTDRRRDWQTQLTSFEEFTSHDEDDHARVPLTAVVETMAERDLPMVYQTLLRPKPDWTDDLEDRRLDIEMNIDTLGGQLANAVFGSPDDSEAVLSASDEERLAELEGKDARCSFEVNARAVAITDDSGTEPPTDDPKRAVREFTSAFSDVSRTSYEIDATVHTGSDGVAVFEAIQERTFQSPNYERLTTKAPWTANTSPGIVADATEAPNFCLLDGAALTTAGTRALAPSRGEQTALPRPTKDELTQYRKSGLTLGQPLSQDDTLTDPIALPPELQPLHVAWFGKTGSGKSTGLTTGMLDNHAATKGASILIEPKGDGMPIEYLRAHYAKYGTLDNVYYFDCAETLPALSFFDIRPQLEAGIDRATAVQNTVDHYIELLIGIMGRDRFERAVRSPDIIRYLVKAMFDPVHGADAFSHRDLQQKATQMAETRDAPPVTDDDLAVMLGGVVTNSKRSFDELMQGVMNRIEKVSLDDRLAHLFNHVPQNTSSKRNDSNVDETAPDPEFDFFDVLNEDAVVIFDTSGLRTESRRALTLVLLSNLWTALRRRQRLHTKERESPEDDVTNDLPLVNLYVEEAAEVAASGLMTDLLAKSRGFNLSVTLAMQFPAQIRNTDTEAYAEILNNISTIITGNVAVDADLEKRLATEDIPPSEVGNRLRALRRGQWFASLPAGFQDREPRPFLLSSAPLPPGHPEGDDPLTETQSLAFEALLDSVKDRTRLDYGLDFLADGQAQSRPNTSIQTTGSENSATATETTNTRVDSALPYTKRLPTCIQYNEDAHAIVCTGCESRHDPSPAGLKRGIKCCSSLDRVDREKIPVCEVNLTLSPQEREESEYSDRQLAFLQVVYAAHQGEYNPEWEYDICWDSMLRLQEYVGIESEAVDELVDDDLLRIDCDHPHRLYTVTADGRNEIQAAHREGIAYGHGVGDLGESSLHRVMVKMGHQYIEEAYVDDSDSDVVEVVPYYELDDGHRLDVAGLDADGNVQAVVEAERANNDILRAVPEDYDKMAALDPEDAIWIVKNRDAAHDVLEALNDPPTGDRRVEKEYSRSSPPRAFRLDAPGCSEIHTLGYVRGSLLDLESP